MGQPGGRRRGLGIDLQHAPVSLLGDVLIVLRLGNLRRQQRVVGGFGGELQCFKQSLFGRVRVGLPNQSGQRPVGLRLGCRVGRIRLQGQCRLQLVTRVRR